MSALTPGFAWGCKLLLCSVLNAWNIFLCNFDDNSPLSVPIRYCRQKPRQSQFRKPALTQLSWSTSCLMTKVHSMVKAPSYVLSTLSFWSTMIMHRLDILFCYELSIYPTKIMRHCDKSNIVNAALYAPVSCDWKSCSNSKMWHWPSVIELTLPPPHQAGSFQNLQTLVEVSSILAAQGVYTNPEQPSEKEELVRQTILTEQPVQQQEQAYQQPLEPAAR